MIRIWNRGRYFLVPWMFFFLAGVCFVYFMGKVELHVWLNARQPRMADPVFRILTRLGEGIALAAALFYLFFRSRYAVGYLVTAWLSTVLVIQLLKQTVFSHMRRPAAVFGHSDAIYYVEGVTYRFSHSFPSGHTGDIFSVCFALALLSAKPKAGVLFFMPALLVAYSRVFLSQHFMQDILAGSFTAVVCASVSFWIWHEKSAGFRAYVNRH